MACDPGRLWWGPGHKEVPIDVGQIESSGPSDMKYFARIVRRVIEDRRLDHLRFLLKWGLDDPNGFIDRRTVVFHVGDERCQTPRYYRNAFHVFKTGGRCAESPALTAPMPVGLKWRVHLRKAHGESIHLLRLLRGRDVTRAVLGRVDEVPLGYFRQLDPPPPEPIRGRPIDVAFAGLLAPPGTPVGVVPSRWARTRLADALRAGAERHPSIRVDWIGRRGAGTAQSERIGPGEYSQFLLDTKISVCPRGNFFETYRILESARAGCVIITDARPERWYFAPDSVVVIDDWRDVWDVAMPLLRDDERMEDFGRRSLAWWRDSLSEDAVARFVIERLVKRLGEGDAGARDIDGRVSACR